MSEVQLKPPSSALQRDVTPEIAHLAITLKGRGQPRWLEAASECERHLMANSAPFQQEEIPL